MIALVELSSLFLWSSFFDCACLELTDHDVSSLYIRHRRSNRRYWYVMASKNEWDIVVVGGSYTDFMVLGTRLPKQGETVVGDTFLLRIPGGKGANQAVAAARLRARVAIITKVGADHRGDEIVTSYIQEGLDIRHVSLDVSEPTGASLIQAEKNG